MNKNRIKLLLFLVFLILFTKNYDFILGIFLSYLYFVEFKLNIDQSFQYDLDRIKDVEIQKWFESHTNYKKY